MRLFGQQFAQGVLRDPVTAILGGISAGTSLIGGIFGSKAAKSAASIQQQAADAAGKKVEDATDAANPLITDAANKASSDATTAAAGAGTADVNTAKTEGQNVIQAGKDAGAGVTTAAVGANKLLDPYATAGATAADVLNKGIAPGGDFNKTPTMADLQIDPGYAFRVQQAQLAMERSAAAHGGVGGGGFAKDLQDYSQGSASQEYQKAFDRFETSTQNRFANVSGVAGQGQVAATKQGGNLIDAGRYVGDTGIATTEHAGDQNIQAVTHAGDRNTQATEFGGGLTYDAAGRVVQNKIAAAKTSADYIVQGANAQAAGKVASTNALWGGINGFTSGLFNTKIAADGVQQNKLISPTPGFSRLPGSNLQMPNQIPTIPGNPYQ